MRVNLLAVGDLQNDFNFKNYSSGCGNPTYWSSTINNANSNYNNAVIMLPTSNGGGVTISQYDKTAYVRPIRSF